MRGHGKSGAMSIRFELRIAVLVLLHLAAHTNAASLEIFPPGDVLLNSVIGSNIILTCKPIADDPTLIRNMQWRDPRDVVIEPLNANQGSAKPMYTELDQDGSLSLYIFSLKEEQTGKYTCKADYTNTQPLVKSVMIETRVAITFEDAQSNQYPILGEDFAIKCKVIARPSPSVAWFYNGALITTNDHYIVETHALRIKKVQASDDGVYICRAFVRATGELKEQPIRVEVHEIPVMESLETTKEIIEGQNDVVHCKARGKPPPKYTWVKTLTQLDLSTADRFRVDKDTGTLSILNANRDDIGEYQCTASNAAGKSYMNIVVNVIVKPKIMEFFNRTVAVDRYVNITCKAFGRPPPKITFRKHTSKMPYELGVQKDDNRIDLKNEADDLSGETSGVLSIQKVTRSDDGLYECVAQNKGGDAYKNGHITVEFPPSFAPMQNRTVWSWEQKPVNLTCTAESIPNATIQWFINNQKIYTEQMITQIGNGPTSILQVTPIDKRYYADYKCSAANIHGTREHTIRLREAHRPAELLQAQVAEVTATTMTFKLVPPPTEEELPVRTITVQYKEEHHTWANPKNRTWTVDSLYIVENLRPQTFYDFRFAAANQVGFGNFGTNLHLSTSQRSVPAAPKMLSKPTEGSEYDTSLQSFQYELRWLPPVNNGEPIDLYEIKYCQIRRVDGDWAIQENTCEIEELRRPQRNAHWLKNLSAETFYTAQIRAHNIMGYGPYGEVRFKTAVEKSRSTPTYKEPLMSSAAIIGIVLGVLFVIIIVIDAICCCVHKAGIIFYVCERSRRKPVDEEDSKLGRDEKEPLREEKKITPIIDSGLRRETSITFDGKRSVSKTGFVGKDSAV